MTRRDFVLIADVILEIGAGAALAMDSAQDRIALAEKFADALASTNPAFDRERFINAATDAQDRADVADPEYDPYA